MIFCAQSLKTLSEHKTNVEDFISESILKPPGSLFRSLQAWMLGILCFAFFRLIFFLCECFLPQNGNPQNPYCSGIEGVMEAYYQSLKSVRLYGPTHFSPVINHVARWVTTLTGGGPKHGGRHTNVRATVCLSGQ